MKKICITILPQIQHDSELERYHENENGHVTLATTDTNATTVEFEGHVSSRKKGPTKKREKKIYFLAGCYLLRAEGFLCSLGVF
jgi:hypothetical protein